MYSQIVAFVGMEGKHNSLDFLPIDKAARLVGLSHWTIRAWLKKGLLMRYKSGPVRIVVNRLELLELVKPEKAGREAL